MKKADLYHMMNTEKENAVQKFLTRSQYLPIFETVKGAAHDHNMVLREFCNLASFQTLFFVFDNSCPYALDADWYKPFLLGPRRAYIVPHGYWTIFTSDDKAYQITQNFGDRIGKGNFKPSRPEEKVTQIGKL